MPAPFSRLRIGFDLFWATSFVACFVAIALSSRDARSLDGAIRLELTPGVQTQGVYRQGRRVGSVIQEVRREAKGWRVERRFELSAGRAAEIRLRLRGDLSLDRIELEADLARIGDLAGLSGLLLGKGQAEARRIHLAGSCDLESGSCRLRGQLGGRSLTLPVAAGRGPVVESAIFPLLARGSLGKTLEVMVFDPLAMQQRMVVYRVEGRESVSLRIGRRPAIRVSCELAGLTTRVWLDERGMVLREELPLGFVIEHESWSES
jgi:hypothetical protein